MAIDDHDHAWGAIRVGLRPSSVLLAGAVATGAAPVIARVPGAGDAGWLAWGIALALCGAGLILSGLRPWLTTLAVVTGAAFLAQLAGLVAGLLGSGPGAWIYLQLVIPKALLLVLLAVVARRQVAPFRRQVLLAAAVMLLLKVVLREMHLVPRAALPWLDLSTSLLLAVALALLARGLRKRETEWARRRLLDVSADLEDFDTKDQDRGVVPPTR